MVTHDEKLKIVNDLLRKSMAILEQKGNSYTSEDCLSNFKQAAMLQECTTAQALWGMAAKHIISISNMISNKIEYDESIWDEKLGDAINYLCLLKVVIKENQMDKGEILYDYRGQNS